jgi:cystathionine beta-synthase
MIFDSVIGAIGNTPIVRLNRLTAHCQANVYGKLEFTNPGGSIKDRIGWWLIEDAEKRGRLQPGGVIIEGTGGNTGIGLAMAAAVKGYTCIFTLPDKMSEMKIRNLRAFGARVIVTPTLVAPEDPRSYYSVARKLAAEIPNSLYIDQYNNLANREHHYRHTGPEILRQMPSIDVFVAGIGTGGTVCGVGRYLKEQKPSVKVIAVDPIGSVVYETFKAGRSGTPHPYLIEGIGKDFIPRNVDFAQLDDVVQVGDKEAFLMTRRLLVEEGIYAGVSSGSAVVGALRWLGTRDAEFAGRNVLIIFPDSGSRYISKVYDDDWMRANGLLEEQGENGFQQISPGGARQRAGSGSR